MKHKHAEVIKAYIDGIQCEYYSNEVKKWGYITQLDTFDWAVVVRIKPEPTPKDKEYYSEDTFDKQYLYVYNDANRRSTWMSPAFIHETYGWNYMGKVEVIK